MPVDVAIADGAVVLPFAEGNSPISGMRLAIEGSMMRIVDGGLEDDGARKATGETV
jgi:hypothetical protein